MITTVIIIVSIFIHYTQMTVTFPIIEKIKSVYSQNVFSMPNNIVDIKIREIYSALLSHESHLTILTSFF